MASSSTTNSDGYVLARTLAEINRLNLQHFFWKKHMGWNLNPRTIPNKPGLRIADVGTGTGIWIFDLADELPKCTSYYGFDIDISQAPHPGFLPPNTHFDVFDALAPLTPEIADKYAGTFDVVNVRFFIWVVRDNDPTTVLENCFKLLKPGGWLQWAEANMTPSHQLGLVASGSQHGDISALVALRDAFLASPSSSSSSSSTSNSSPTSTSPTSTSTSTSPSTSPPAIGAWIDDLGTHAAKAGFVDAGRTDVPNDANHPTWAAMQMSTTLAAYANVIERMPDGARKDGLWRLHGDAARAVGDGCRWGIHWVTHVARRPE